MLLEMGNGMAIFLVHPGTCTQVAMGKTERLELDEDMQRQKSAIHVECLYHHHPFSSYSIS